jgi:formate C-acetyltransferase
MATTASGKMGQANTISAWTGFKPGLWQREINIRGFIQQNYEPYEGNGSFLGASNGAHKETVGPVERTFCRREQERRA